jgi:hypothetical protein
MIRSAHVRRWRGQPCGMRYAPGIQNRQDAARLSHRHARHPGTARQGRRHRFHPVRCRRPMLLAVLHPLAPDVIHRMSASRSFCRLRKRWTGVCNTFQHNANLVPVHDPGISLPRRRVTNETYRETPGRCGQQRANCCMGAPPAVLKALYRLPASCSVGRRLGCRGGAPPNAAWPAARSG